MVYLPLPFVLKNILMLGVSPGGGGLGGLALLEMTFVLSVKDTWESTIGKTDGSDKSEQEPVSFRKQK